MPIAASTTQTLALLIGLYMLAGGVALLTDRENYSKIIDEFRSSAALTFIAGILVFMIGGVIVALHNVWTTPIRIVVSLIGWAALIEGVLLIAARRPFLAAISRIPMTAKAMRQLAHELEDLLRGYLVGGQQH